MNAILVLITAYILIGPLVIIPFLHRNRYKVTKLDKLKHMLIWPVLPIIEYLLYDSTINSVTVYKYVDDRGVELTGNIDTSGISYSTEDIRQLEEGIKNSIGAKWVAVTNQIRLGE